MNRVVIGIAAGAFAVFHTISGRTLPLDDGDRLKPRTRR